MSDTAPAAVAVDYPLHRVHGIEPPPDLARLRSAGPVHRVRMADGAQAWLVTRYAEVREVLGSPAFGTQYPGTVPVADADNLAAGFMFLRDPPEHTRLRRSVSRAFTARRVALLRGHATAVAAELADGLAAAGPGVDVQAAFAFPLPIAVITELLGIPPTDRDRFVRWADIVLRPGAGAGEDGWLAYLDLQKFVLAMVAAKPDGSDLLSELAEQPDPAHRLDRLELASMAMGLLMAGYVTTASAISHGLLRLCGAPDVLAGLRSGALPTERVVEELLRLQDEEIGIMRVAQSDVTVAGVHIARGDTVIASRSGSNRDPGEFTEPDALDPAAARGAHLAFGHGIHHCLGSALARMELAVALDALVARFPGLRLAVAPEEVEWSATGMDVVIDRLPIAW